MSVNESYRLKVLITLEQVNTTEWLKKIRILISKIAMVGCCKLIHCMQMSLVMSMQFISSDWNDMPCKSLSRYLAMMQFLWKRDPWIFVYLYMHIGCYCRGIFGRR